MASAQAERLRGTAPAKRVARALALAGILVSSTTTAQLFRSRVELVQLQTSVTDERGAFVSGLRAQDFVVRVDGEVRPVQVLYEVDALADRRSPGEGSIEPDRNVAPRPVAARRHLMLLFDLSFTTRRGIRESREAALAFLEQQVGGADLVGVASVNRYGLEMPVPFTADLSRVRDAVSSLRLSDVTDLHSEEELSAADFSTYVAEVVDYIEAVRYLGETMQALGGRKHLVLFSKGFLDHVVAGADLDTRAARSENRLRGGLPNMPEDPDFLAGSAEIRAGLADAVAELREGDVVVHAVDPSGLEAPGSGHQSLAMLADGTGGTTFRYLNNLTPALREIGETSRRFYMIAYRKRPTDPATVEVSIEVSHPDVRAVRAPTRLTTPPPFAQMTNQQRQLQLAVALASDVDTPGIDVQARARTFSIDDRQQLVLAFFEIGSAEIGRLASLGTDREVRLEVLGLAVETGGALLGEFRRGVRIPLSLGTYPGIHESQILTVPHDVQRLRLVVRDAEVGELTVVNVVLPDPVGHGDIGEPIIVEARALSAPQSQHAFDLFELGRRSLVPIAAPTAAPGDEIMVMLPMLASPDRALAPPETSDLVVTLTPDGASGSFDLAVISSDVTRSTELGLVAAIVRVVIPEAAPAGRVSLSFAIRDRVATTTLTLRNDRQAARPRP